MSITEIIFYVLAIVFEILLIVHSSNSIKEIRSRNKNPLRDKFDKGRDNRTESKKIKEIITEAFFLFGTIVALTIKLSNIK